MLGAYYTLQYNARYVLYITICFFAPFILEIPIKLINYGKYAYPIISSKFQ